MRELMSAAELIEQAAAEVEAIRFRLWSELEEDDPALICGPALKSAYLSLEQAADHLRFALTGKYPPREEGENDG